MGGGEEWRKGCHGALEEEIEGGMEIFEGRRRRGVGGVGMEEDPNRGLRKIMKRRKWTWAMTSKHWRGSTSRRHEVVPELLRKHDTTV